MNPVEQAQNQTRSSAQVAVAPSVQAGAPQSNNAAQNPAFTTVQNMQQPLNQTFVQSAQPVATVSPTPVQPATKAAPNTTATTPAAPPTTVKNPNSTQNTLLFEELRDNLVVMGDGSFRAIVEADSVNFDLMSEREREGIEYSYQNFLNSLTFPIQIYVRSQKVDIGPYLDKLEDLRQNQDNMLLGVLMDDYISFIDALSQEANIMDKSFFVVIPYQLGDEHQQLGKDSDTTKGLLTNLFMPAKKHQRIKIPADHYTRVKDMMDERVASVIDGLSEIGVRAVRLKTKELGTLYYNVYNPDTAVHQPITDFRNYESTVIRKGEGPAPTPNSVGTGGTA
jgi:hypothetical protein